MIVAQMSSTAEILQWAAGLGVGGVLAAFIFVWAWRSLQANYEELKRLIDEQKGDKRILIDLVGYTNKVISENSKATDDNANATRDNTSAIRELRQALDARQQRRG